mmetsp:Transcript_49740/g.105932  ORF Transcript_49740/g.105932 Transcript_49740/m.105932 type:complete len:210 (+) Transcript_49740:521-1150(+)
MGSRDGNLCANLERISEVGAATATIGKAEVGTSWVDLDQKIQGCRVRSGHWRVRPAEGGWDMLQVGSSVPGGVTLRGIGSVDSDVLPSGEAGGVAVGEREAKPHEAVVDLFLVHKLEVLRAVLQVAPSALFDRLAANEPREEGPGEPNRRDSPRNNVLVVLRNLGVCGLDVLWDHHAHPKRILAEPHATNKVQDNPDHPGIDEERLTCQ